MSRLKTALQNDIKLLTLLRDELALQAHLFKADATVKWAELEQQWQALKTHAERTAVVGAQAERETEAAITLLADTLKDGYGKIRETLRA